MSLNTLLYASASSDFLHDPFWVFIIGTVIAILGIIATLWIYRKQRTRKIIFWEVISEAPVASITEDVVDRVEILFDGKPVKNLNLLVLKVWNTGTEDTEIYRHDEQTKAFEIPFSFIFEGRNIIARSILNTEPEVGVIEKQDLDTYHKNPDPRTDVISLPHCLLKPRQAFKLRILLTGPIGEIRTEGKLVNFEFREYKFSPTLRVLSIVPILLLLIAGSIFLIASTGGATSSPFIGQIVATFSVTVAAIIGFYFGSRSTAATARQLL